MLAALAMSLVLAQPAPPAVAADWRAERAGFHFALGAGGMVLPTSGSRAPLGLVAVLPAFDYGFGWVDVRATVQLLGYFTSFKAGFAALDLQLRLNLARFFSVGAGPYFGIAASPSIDLAAGVSVSPAVVKLGDRGQHEFSIWVSLPFVATNPAVVLALVGYTYVF